MILPQSWLIIWPESIKQIKAILKNSNEGETTFYETIPRIVLMIARQKPVGIHR